MFCLEVHLGGSWRGVFGLEVPLGGVFWAWRRGVFGLEVHLGGSWRGAFGLEEEHHEHQLGIFPATWPR